MGVSLHMPYPVEPDYVMYSCISAYDLAAPLLEHRHCARCQLWLRKCSPTSVLPHASADFVTFDMTENVPPLTLLSFSMLDLCVSLRHGWCQQNVVWGLLYNLQVHSYASHPQFTMWHLYVPEMLQAGSRICNTAIKSNPCQAGLVKCITHSDHFQLP